MNLEDRETIGQRIRELRKRKGYNQSELAALLGKSLRTVQKYESGEIEISIAMVNEIAGKLDTTSTYLLGYEAGAARINCLSDIMGFFFQMEKVMGLNFSIDVKKPPHDEEWQCSLTFKGKDKSADFNADMCLFLEEWAEYRDEFRDYMISKGKYTDWQDKTLAYYAASAMETEEPAELDEMERLQKRNERMK